MAIHTHVAAAAAVATMAESDSQASVQSQPLVRTHSDAGAQRALLGSSGLVAIVGGKALPTSPAAGQQGSASPLPKTGQQVAASSLPKTVASAESERVAAAPAIGQEVMRAERERHTRNTSYGNYSGVVHYNIKVKGSGHYLKQDIGEDALVKCVDLALLKEDGYARFRLVAEVDGHFRIRNTASHNYLWEYDSDSQVRGTRSLGDTYTSFEMEPQADWSYRMKVVGSHHYLHEDVATGILAGGTVTNDMGNFILVPLECCEQCSAYLFEAVCPPDRCSWLGTSCAGLRIPIQGAASRHILWAALAALMLLAESFPALEC